MNTTNNNGRVERKTLASQLDRLDNVIDALADGVNKAVADAVREGVTLAVQQAIELVVREVLARPELLQKLTGQAAPAAVPVAAEPATTKRSLLMQVLTWVGSKIRGACNWAGKKARGVPARIGSIFQRVCEKGQKAWIFRGAIAVSLLIGLVVGVVGYLAGPFLSSLALGACSSAMSLGAILAAPFVRLWRSWQPQNS